MSHSPQDDSTNDLAAALARLEERTDEPQPAYVPTSSPTPVPYPTVPIGQPGSRPVTPLDEFEEPDEPDEPGESTDPVSAPLRIDDHTFVRAPAAVDVSFTIEVVAGHGVGQVVPVGRKPVVVGRLLGGIKVDDPFVSEAHASFFVRNGEPVVADGGSPSGVFVEVARRVALAQGDVFACGLQVFRFLGAVEPATTHQVYGAPLPFKAYRLEHVLVGGRSGRVVLFRHTASVGRRQGSLQFPDDGLLDDLHVELKAGPHGMALVTHSRNWPVFMRIPTGAEVVLGDATLVRIGTSTLRIVVG